MIESAENFSIDTPSKLEDKSLLRVAVLET